MIRLFPIVHDHLAINLIICLAIAIHTAEVAIAIASKIELEFGEVFQYN